MKRAYREIGLIVALIGVYLGFVVWMYVSEPLLLGVFSAALALLWLRDAVPRILARFLVGEVAATRRGEGPGG